MADRDPTTENENENEFISVDITHTTSDVLETTLTTGAPQESADTGSGSHQRSIHAHRLLAGQPDTSLQSLSRLDSEKVKDKKLFSTRDGFTLGTWDNDDRRAYIESRVNGSIDESLPALDMAQFLRYRYEHGKTVGNYLKKWNDDKDLRETCESLAEVAGDDGYERMLGGDRSLGSFEDEG